MDGRRQALLRKPQQLSALRIAVLGAGGRMGRTVIASATAAPEQFSVCGALVEPGSAELGRDAGSQAGVDPLGVNCSDRREAVLADADVAVDFTLPAAFRANLAACRAAGCALVVGTTGLDADDQEALAEAKSSIPIVYARNMSVGVNLMLELAAVAARALGEDFDAEIVEAHHRRKLDAPSGTALALGERVAEARGKALEAVARYGREGRTGPRPAGEIGFSVLRAGGIVGEHTLLLADDQERIEITHRAASRRAFSEGALRAAAWLQGRAPGLYDMRDVLGLRGLAQ